MLGKLIRYEFKNLNKWFFWMYPGVLGLALVLALIFPTSADFYRNFSDSSSFGAFIGLIQLLVVPMVIITVTLFIATYVHIINRFRHGVFGREGYLTMTLPVKTEDIITSKLISGLIWIFLALITFVLSIYLFVLIMVLKTSPQSAGYILPELFKILGILLASPTSWSWLVTNLLSTAASILTIYLAIAIGNLFDGRRNLMAVVSWIGLVIVYGFLSSIITMSSLSISSRTDIDNLASYTGPATYILWVFYILLIVGQYFGIYKIVKERLNLV